MIRAGPIGKLSDILGPLAKLTVNLVTVKDNYCTQPTVTNLQRAVEEGPLTVALPLIFLEVPSNFFLTSPLND